jgi:integrase/recombinase XerD
MQTLVEDFLQYLRNERGQSENTQKTYAALLGKFTAWAQAHDLNDWRAVELRHLMAFLQHERHRPLAVEQKESARRLSSESVYLEIAALRAFYRFAENEKFLPLNVAENLSLPCRWQRLPKALSNHEMEQLLAPVSPETAATLCDQAILELAYASGLRLSELRNIRLEQLQLEAGFINVIGKGNKERVVPLGRKAVAALRSYLEAGRPKLVTPRTPANVFLTRRGRGCPRSSGRHARLTDRRDVARARLLGLGRIDLDLVDFAVDGELQFHAMLLAVMDGELSRCLDGNSPLLQPRDAAQQADLADVGRDA